jgi:hypothetical protein
MRRRYRVVRSWRARYRRSERAENQMAFRVRRVEYFYATVRDQAGEAFKVLSALAGRGVNLVAFTAVPVGPTSSQLAIFPDDPALLRTEATHARLALDGGHFALLVQGDDELGVLARIHKRLFDADINVYASSGIADGKGSFAYLIYVRAEDFDLAARTLEV